MCLQFRPKCSHHPDPLITGPLQILRFCPRELNKRSRAAAAAKAAEEARKAAEKPPGLLARIYKPKDSTPATSSKTPVGNRKISAPVLQEDFVYDPSGCPDRNFYGYVESQGSCRECNGGNAALRKMGCAEEILGMRTVSEVEEERKRAEVQSNWEADDAPRASEMVGVQSEAVKVSSPAVVTQQSPSGPIVVAPLPPMVEPEEFRCLVGEQTNAALRHVDEQHRAD